MPGYMGGAMARGASGGLGAARHCCAGSSPPAREPPPPVIDAAMLRASGPHPHGACAEPCALRRASRKRASPRRRPRLGAAGGERRYEMMRPAARDDMAHRITRIIVAHAFLLVPVSQCCRLLGLPQATGRPTSS